MDFGEFIGKIIKYTLLLVLIYSLFLKDSQKDPILELKEEEKISKEDNLLKKGQLITEGYSTEKMINFNSSDIYPAFFGLPWLHKEFRFKQLESFYFFNDQKLTKISFIDSYHTQAIHFYEFDFSQKSTISRIDLIHRFNDTKRFELQRESAFDCNSNFDVQVEENEFLVRSKLQDKICNYFVDYKINGKQYNSQQMVIQTEEQVHDIYSTSEDKSQWVYAARYMNNQCGDKCLGQVEIVKANLSYNYSYVNFKSSGYSGSIPISINIESGLQNSKNAKSLPQTIKIENKIIKLLPVVIKYEKLNYFNGMQVFTYDNSEQTESYENQEEEDKQQGPNRIHLTFQTFGKQSYDKNYVLLKSKNNLISGKIKGWVTDDQGVKYEIEDFSAIFETIDIRG